MSKSIGSSHPIETYTKIKQNVKIYRVYSSHKNIYKISQMSKSIGSSHPIKTYTKISQMSRSIGYSHPIKTSKNWNSKTKFNKPFKLQDSPCRLKPFTPDHNLRTNNYATFAQPKYRGPSTFCFQGKFFVRFTFPPCALSIDIPSNQYWTVSLLNWYNITVWKLRKIILL
jgi:hypothetical protein